MRATTTGIDAEHDDDRPGAAAIAAETMETA